MSDEHSQPDDEFRRLCVEIVAEALSETQWAERESDDMFQTEHYSGGYDATEEARVARGEPVILDERPSE